MEQKNVPVNRGSKAPNTAETPGSSVLILFMHAIRDQREYK